MGREKYKLDRFKSEIEDWEPLSKEPPKDFKGKVKNFFTYYSWTIVVSLVCAAAVVYTCFAVFGQKQYDLTIVMAYSGAMDTDYSTNLHAELEKFCEDYNDDGSVNLFLVPIIFGGADAGSAYPAYDTANQTKFISELQLKKNVLFIFNDEKYEKTDISVGFSEITTGSEDNKRLYFKDTQIPETLARDDLFFTWRNHYSTDKEIKAAEEAAAKFIEKIRIKD